MTNAKTAKAIRRALPHHRMAIHERVAVDSNRKQYTTTIFATDTEQERVLQNTALQVRLQPGCPRDLYQRMKKYVQSSALREQGSKH